MEDESIQKDEEKLKSLLETLKKNDENVPEELLKTKYKKPYRELKDSIKEVADQISGRRIRQDIVIKNDDAGQVLIKQIQEMLEEKRRAGTGKELGRTLYKGIQCREIPTGGGRNQNSSLESVDTLLATTLLLIRSTGVLR